MWRFETDSVVQSGIEVQNWKTIEDDHSVRFILDKATQKAESERHSVLVVGRLRAYGADYEPDGSATMLLELVEQLGTGPALYKALAGFFVAFICNRQTGTINVINDHMGTVPLFWYRNNQAKRFDLATSLIALKEVNHGEFVLSKQSIFNYMYFHCIPSPFTVYEDVFKLPPGVKLSVDKQLNSEVEDCYTPTYESGQMSNVELQSRCREMVEQAVKRNIGAHNGAFLSGGLDSSTVAGYLSKYTDKAKSFSIGFEAKGFDETYFAQVTAKHFELEHKVHYLQPEEIASNFERVAGHFSEPFGNSSSLAALVCAEFARLHGVQIMLAGDGGDEIFAGNERYAKQKVFDIYHNLPGFARNVLKGIFKHTFVGNLGPLNKGRSYIEQAETPLPERLDTYNFLKRFPLDEIFCHDFLLAIDPELPAEQKRQRYSACENAQTTEKLLYLDWKFTLADNDLVKVTGMCDLADVEVRFPLLEKELVDFACKVPADIKLPGNKLRDFYKKSFSGFLSDETLNKSKHGFGLPFGLWMKDRSELRDMAERHLNDLKGRKIFNKDFIDTALKTYYSGHASYYGELIWIMVVLEIWLKKHVD
ncbi:asparagine synthase (glutamine-hydrolyzing) [Bowmanella denitrificans]|uniref:asparagine synthase (glutamine-hydrolyzing) n=1 Tax=Bowmanella denitrificans TaxID=366582 RepID=A0ABP3HH98_9ALTE